MAKNIIYVGKKKEVRINRDRNGGVVRITNEAADILENMLSQVPQGELTACKLASNLIVYGANNTIIRVEDND